MNSHLPFSVMKKLLKEAGADRISQSSLIELRKILEKKANNKSKKAITLANHANRKTIKKEDITLTLDLNSH